MSGYSGVSAETKESWTSVGWAAVTEAAFALGKEEVSTQGMSLTTRLDTFHPDPMAAIYECRKAALRELGGSLSTGPVTKKELRNASVKDVEGALMSPNFVLFELVTSGNMPSLVCANAVFVVPNSNWQTYRLPMSECPFCPAHDFADQFRFLAKHCTIYPHLCGNWIQKSPKGPLPGLAYNFRYYVAIDDTGNEDDVTEANPLPLLMLLARNDPSSESPFKTTNVTGGAIPLASPQQVAMHLGFFAYKLTKLKMVELCYTGLIGGQAPHSHPMGSFWVLRMDILATMLQEGRMQIQYAPYEMTLTMVGQAMTSDSLFLDASVLNLRKRKRQLEADIADLTDQVGAKKSELASVNGKLEAHATITAE